MRRAALLAPLAGLALALAAPSAGAMDHDMTMGPGGAPAAGAAAPPGVSVLFSAFNAPRLNIVTGDTVRWSNDSARAHDVVSSDGGFDSGRLPVGGTYAHRFDAPGAMTYYCSIHPFMTGEIDVHPVVLEAPTQHAGSGKPFVLSGRVAAGTTGSVAIEGDSGGGFVPAGTAVVGADGTFRTTVVPRATTSYRATIDGQDSPAVPLLVLDHHVSVGAMDHGRHTMVTIRVAPAAAGQTVVLQLRLPERFGWWPVAQARLGRDSTATFDIPRRGRVPARVLLTQPDGATELARSRTVHVGPVVRRR